MKKNIHRSKSRGFNRFAFEKHFEGLDGPGYGLERFLFVDIECAKVAAPKGWPQSTRFQTVMIGIGYYEGDGKKLERVIEVVEGEERELMRWFDDVLDGGYHCVVFSATRDFDRNVLKGLWVNARRALAKKPGPWPTIRPMDDGEDDLPWVNIHKLPAAEIDRSTDPFWKKSKEICAWPNVDQDGVREHNRLDVLEMMVRLEEKFV